MELVHLYYFVEFIISCSSVPSRAELKGCLGRLDPYLRARCAVRTVKGYEHFQSYVFIAGPKAHWPSQSVLCMFGWASVSERTIAYRIYMCCTCVSIVSWFKFCSSPHCIWTVCVSFTSHHAPAQERVYFWLYNSNGFISIEISFDIHIYTIQMNCWGNTFWERVVAALLELYFCLFTHQT